MGIQQAELTCEDDGEEQGEEAGGNKLAGGQ